MPDTPPMPEVVARHFKDAVEASARKVHRRWQRVFTIEDLISEAWIIALQRWQLWSDQIPFARRDLGIHLLRWVRSELYARGWTQITVDGQRRWQPPAASETSWNPDWLAVLGDQTPEATEDDEDCELSLSPDWAPMGRRKRELYARILFQRYPVLVAEFEAVVNQVKPVKLSHGVWVRRQERARAELRVKYATELATARYAVEGFAVEAVAA